MTNPTWGGRFDTPPNRALQDFCTSIDVDQRLYPYDIAVSQAHAKTLARAKVITAQHCQQICEHLHAIKDELDQGHNHWLAGAEDIHMAIEQRLVQRLGEVGKQLHTGRSRNDQSVTGLRLFLLEQSRKLGQQLHSLAEQLLTLAEQQANTVMPGYTHMQLAQPVTVGHHMLAWFEMLHRDRQRLAELEKRLDVMPLGSGALAGSGYPLDRWFCARQLGFSQISRNSLDAVSDRDFAIEWVSAAALLMTHYSRWAEEVITWVSPHYDFARLPEALCTGSSLMPQKQNPDLMELMRGKTGRVYGHLQHLLTLMKGQRLAYNRDNQEDKQALFDALDTVTACTTIWQIAIPELTFQPQRLREAAQQGHSNATDLADYLVARGVAFRNAHHLAGAAVRLAVTKQCTLQQLSLDEFHTISSVIDEGVYDYLTVERSLAARDVVGGVAPQQIQQALKEARTMLVSHQATPVK